MRRILLTLGALLVLAPALAADPLGDSVNYSRLANFPKRVDALLKDLDQLKVSVRLRSKDPKLKPSDITVEAKLSRAKW